MVACRFVFALAAWMTLAASSHATSSAATVELLDFYLPTCGPCRAMAPHVDRLEAQGVAVRRIDGSREPHLAARFGIDSYPTFVAVDGGRETGRVVGATTPDRLRRLVAARPTTDPFAVQPPAAAPMAPGSLTVPAARPSAVAANSPPSPSTADAARLAASVRLTVEDANGRSYGTGTLVDAREGEALIVTCGHLFRGPDGAAIDTTGRLSIEIFESGPSGVRVVDRVSGELISHDFDADVALVAIRPNRPVTVAPVVGSPAEVRVGDSVWSVGCDLGADPTVRTSRVVALNRYTGPPNIEAAGAPVQGRSGGGLFDASGRLVGVCFAADEPADEGLYAGVASIHAQLDRVGLSELYRANARPEPLADLASATAAPGSSDAGLSPVRVAPGATSIVRGQTPEIGASVPAWGGTQQPAPATTATADSVRSLEPAERATLDELASLARSSEVVVLVRPQGGEGRTEVLTLDAASPEFVAALRRLGGEPAATLR